MQLLSSLDERNFPTQRMIHRANAAYHVPENVQEVDLSDLLSMRGGSELEPKQLGLMLGDRGVPARRVYYAGNIENLTCPAVAIVGTRNVSPQGAARARKLARAMARDGVAVVSGLAAGVDTAALTEALKHNGRVAAVIGTPIDKAYPAQNSRLQETIYRDYLLVSQFAVGSRTFRSNFPERNRLMAALTDATVVIEASDTSGTLHQSAECVRLGRWLFIARSVAEDTSLSWPAKFLSYEKCVVLTDPQDITDRIVSK